MKKTTKIITLILSALLLIGCAIGISVSAEENAPTVSIKYKNIAYEGAPQVLYAVEAANVPDGAAVQMYFYDAEPTEGAIPAYIKNEHSQTITIGGTEYKAFFSDGIAPKNMRKTIYAVPVIALGEEVLAYGEPVAYSIFTYAVNMFSKAPTEEQKALYTALLDYGASVQRLLLGTEDYTEADLLAAGGYANEYCGIKLNTVVDGEIVDSNLFGTYAPGTKVALNTAKVYNGMLFDGFTDAEGNAVLAYDGLAANSYNKCDVFATEIGVTEYNCNYSSYATVFTYDEEGKDASDYVTLSTNTALDAPKVTTVTTANGEYKHTSSAYATITDSLYDSKVLEFNKIRKVIESTDPSFPVGTMTTASLGQTSISFSNTHNAESIYDVDYHVFETDFYHYHHNKSGTTSIQFFFKNSSGNVWAWNLETNKNTSTFLIKVKDGADNGHVIASALPQAEWMNLRVEIHPVANSDDIAFKVFINGVFTGTTFTIPTAPAACADDKDAKLTDISVMFLGAMNDDTMAFDNTAFYTVTKPVSDYYGKGLYADDEATNGLDDDDTVNYASVSAATIADENGNNVLNFEKANDTSASLAFPVYATGKKFIFETDIRWNGYTAKVDNWLGRFGFTTPESRDLGNELPYVKENATYVTTGDDLYLNNRDNVSVCPILRNGVWYNLRVEYVPTGYDESTEKYIGNEYIYVNNELLLVYENVPFASDSSNCYNFRFGFRSANGFSLTLDNIYVGYESGYTDYFGQGVYYEQSYKYGANDNGVGANKIIAKAETTTTLSNVLEGENYALKLAKKYDGTYLSSNKLWFNVNPNATTLTEGQSYVFETDFKWLGSTANYSGYRCAQLGFVPTVDSTNLLGQNYFYPTTSAAPGVTSLYYDVNNATDGYYNTSKIDKDIVLNSEFIFEANVWYNIRFEYTPTGTDDSGNYTATQRFYVNNVLVYEGTVTSATNNTNAAAFLITAKKYSGEMNMLFDNTYGGIIDAPAAE